jgi:hypothetical protein
MVFLPLSNQNDKGNVYCSLILAQNITFLNLMEKARSSLANMEFGIFPKASDHDEAAEVGWLSYSTRFQDEEWISDLISTLVRESVEAKGRPMCTNNRNHKEAEDANSQTYALHLESIAHCASAIRKDFQSGMAQTHMVF